MIRSNPLTYQLPYPVQLRLEVFKVGMIVDSLSISFRELGKASEETAQTFSTLTKALKNG